MTEHQIQSDYFNWVEVELYPNGVPVEALKGIELAHAIPNGGDRHVLVGAKLKKEGARKGVPDVYIPVPRGGFCGLAIEFKSLGGTPVKTPNLNKKTDAEIVEYFSKKQKLSKPGTPTEEQINRIERMQREGWCAVMCWSAEAAKRVTIGYLGMACISYKD